MPGCLLASAILGPPVGNRYPHSYLWICGREVKRDTDYLACEIVGVLDSSAKTI